MGAALAAWQKAIAEYNPETGQLRYREQIFTASFLAAEEHASAVEETATEGEAGHEEHEAKEPFGTSRFWLYTAISAGLTCFAGLMSGLTVGLLSIDKLELEMKLENGTDQEKAAARRVLPILEKHHYLLVTLLLCNAFAMEALPIFLDRLVSAVMAVAISVTAILFFGEIIPQAICTGPQQIFIADKVAPMVNFLMIACGIIAYPISRILDYLLGEHHITRYCTTDLKTLIDLHSKKAF